MRSATIARPVRIEGRGIFSGERCLCTIRPWEDGLPAPLTFRLGDSLIPALPPFFGRQPNCTSFTGPDGAAVAVTEHLFAALWAAGIDHALIETNRAELPNHDGSAITLYEDVADAGRTELGERRLLELAEPVRVESADGAHIELSPTANCGGGGPPPSSSGSAGVPLASVRRQDAAATSNGISQALPLHISYTFAHPQLGEQHIALEVTRESAVREILPARTFATVEEAEALIAAGLLHNRHTEDAILLSPPHAPTGPSGTGASAPAHAYVPSTPLRFADEFARHKVLDLLGDIYCAGVELSGRLNAVRSGHGLNRALAAALYALR